MEDTIIKPRCPNCGKAVSEWLRGAAAFTCPRCHVRFVIQTIKLGGLTIASTCGIEVVVLTK